MKVYVQELRANYQAKGGPAIYVVSAEYADFDDLPACAEKNGRLYWKGRTRDWFDDYGYTMYRECDSHSSRHATPDNTAQMVVDDELYAAEYRKPGGIVSVEAIRDETTDPADYWKQGTD